MIRSTLRNLRWVIAGGATRYAAGRYGVWRLLPGIHEARDAGDLSDREALEMERDLWALAGEPKMAAIMQDHLDGVYDGLGT